MGVYADDRRWSDLMIDQIRNIVGPYLLKPTPFEMDTKQAADLFVFTGLNMTIAARVRRPGFERKYPFEFTIRWARDNGVKTELSKIIDGWGNWFFYGHSNDDDEISRWWLIDLVSFRAALIRHPHPRLVFQKRDNRDGTKFIAYDLRSFPSDPPILVASSHALLSSDKPPPPDLFNFAAAASPPL